MRLPQTSAYAICKLSVTQLCWEVGLNGKRLGHEGGGLMNGLTPSLQGLRLQIPPFSLSQPWETLYHILLQPEGPYQKPNKCWYHALGLPRINNQIHFSHLISFSVCHLVTASTERTKTITPLHPQCTQTDVKKAFKARDSSINSMTHPFFKMTYIHIIICILYS